MSKLGIVYSYLKNIILCMVRIYFLQIFAYKLYRWEMLPLETLLQKFNMMTKL